MNEKNYTGLIPPNEQGTSLMASSVRTMHSDVEAGALFESASKRLTDVNEWEQIAGKGWAAFQLFDPAGKEEAGPAKKGHLIRIDIPGPGAQSTEGYDWVRIEEMGHYDTADVQSIAMRVRPISPPGSETDSPAHFYSQEATSTFTVTREAYTVSVAIYDRNIEVNTEAMNLTDRIRNAVTGFVGKNVFSKMQWQALADGVLDAPK